MGKYMKKAKEKGEVAVMEMVQPSSLGVRTRAKTLALQRLQNEVAEGGAGGGGGSYLELRSRRLEKPTALFGAKRQKHRSSKQSNSMFKSRQRGGNFKKKRGSLGEEKIEEENGKEEKIFEEKLGKNERNGKEQEGDRNGDEDACFGENVLEEIDGRESKTRESTPCNLVMGPENIGTPGSSTKHPRTSEADSRVQNPILRDIPTTQEMDQFFACQEEQQQKQFIEKYNFDPVNDKPLPGSFEWVKVDP